jgi:hypothetical protein
MKPEGSFPHSQEPATCPVHAPKSQSPKSHFNITLRKLLIMKLILYGLHRLCTDILKEKVRKICT